MRIPPLVFLALAGCAVMRGSDPSAIAPFKISVPQAVLDDLQQRLARTRWPEAAPGNWQYGVPLDTVKALVAHWRTGYDWRKHETALNARSQFTTEIDGLKVHFLHVRSRHEKALPLVLVHGWPGSFVEFMKMIGPLTEPEKFG